MARSNAAARIGAAMLIWAAGSAALVVVWSGVNAQPAIAQEQPDLVDDEEAAPTTDAAETAGWLTISRSAAPCTDPVATTSTRVRS